ncbi:uncharacterized protein N7515_001125 [Penicillium bovifimosum]|uniref:MINDY deubiquitinase domain-containing protein n=1 Tax=Penicillium bovifimosum TaxID=126998 RepID=A0A9W9LC39_9EURO|nr:uncharacterized protein N7515_001125 [Penicillium bovifimosum]KAJ5146561.1 hypothetical protein N7515_001125 [Penicillium bovifimosum]
MGLRKQPPPRLQNIRKSNARSDARSPESPTSANTHRSTRLDRFPSDDSIYSPDLNTSPAFDLMPLEEAQRSPVGSPTCHPPNLWPDSPGKSGHDHYSQLSQYHGAYHPKVENNNAHCMPQSLMAGQYSGEAENVWRPASGAGDASTGELPVQLQSNNPFLKPRPTDHTQGVLDRNEWGRDSHATLDSDPLSQTEGYIPMTARLSLLDQSEENSPWDEPSRPAPQSEQRPGHHLEDNSPWESQQSIKVSAPQDICSQEPQLNPDVPGVTFQLSDRASGEHYVHSQHPYSSNTGRLEPGTGINTPSVTLSTATSATSHELIDLGVPGTSGKLGVDTGSHAASSVYSEPAANGAPPVPDRTKFASSELGPLDTAENQRPKPQPSPVLSAAEAARQKEQRSETYTIRHVRWTDQSGRLLESPVLVQNQNGPCPLLALINALVLRANPEAQPPIVRALSTREQISLGLLIEAMFEELTTCLGPDQEFPDIEALTQFLTMLHTGMNVNPRLTMDSTEGVGTFLETNDLRLYSTFGIPLIHAWLASWSSPTHAAMSRIAQYYDDIQMLPFRKQEFEDRITRGEALTPEEESTMEDIQTIQQFVEIENATQLSPFGLTQLSSKLAPGSVSILFRNDHFSTLYKHPQSHQLYTLVTDAGYAGHAEVVWESLVDVTGFNTEYYSGDFRPVGAGPSENSGPAGPRTSSAPAAQPVNEAPGTPEPSQEQSDADYAYALSLQFQEEEQRASAREGQERGPRVPARTSSAANVMGSQSEPRPHHASDHDDPNAPPPPYEQAAGGPRYSPPDRRSYGGQGNQYPGNRNPHGPYSHRPRPSLPTGADRMTRDRSKDCIVM